MTENEQTLLKGQVVEEHKRLRDEEACLVAKAHRISAQLSEWSKYLHEVVAMAGDTELGYHPHDSPTWDDIAGVHQRTMKVRARIRELEDLFRQWGVLR